jgi:hypothetical protein
MMRVITGIRALRQHVRRYLLLAQGGAAFSGASNSASSASAAAVRSCAVMAIRANREV